MCACDRVLERESRAVEQIACRPGAKVVEPIHISKSPVRFEVRAASVKPEYRLSQFVILQRPESLGAERPGAAARRIIADTRPPATTRSDAADYGVQRSAEDRVNPDDRALDFREQLGVGSYGAHCGGRV